MYLTPGNPRSHSLDRPGMPCLLTGGRIHGGLGEMVKLETEDFWHPPVGTAGKVKTSLITG